MARILSLVAVCLAMNIILPLRAETKEAVTLEHLVRASRQEDHKAPSRCGPCPSKTIRGCSLNTMYHRVMGTCFPECSVFKAPTFAPWLSEILLRSERIVKMKSLRSALWHSLDKYQSSLIHGRVVKMAEQVTCNQTKYEQACQETQTKLFAQCVAPAKVAWNQEITNDDTLSVQVENCKAGALDMQRKCVFEHKMICELPECGRPPRDARFQMCAALTKKGARVPANSTLDEEKLKCLAGLQGKLERADARLLIRSKAVICADRRSVVPSACTWTRFRRACKTKHVKRCTAIMTSRKSAQKKMLNRASIRPGTAKEVKSVIFKAAKKKLEADVLADLVKCLKSDRERCHPRSYKKMKTERCKFKKMSLSLRERETFEDGLKERLAPGSPFLQHMKWKSALNKCRSDQGGLWQCQITTGSTLGYVCATGLAWQQYGFNASVEGAKVCKGTFGHNLVSQCKESLSDGTVALSTRPKTRLVGTMVAKSVVCMPEQNINSTASTRTCDVQKKALATNSCRRLEPYFKTKTSVKAMNKLVAQSHERCLVDHANIYRARRECRIRWKHEGRKAALEGQKCLKASLSQRCRHYVSKLKRNAMLFYSRLCGSQSIPEREELTKTLLHF